MPQHTLTVDFRVEATDRTAAEAALTARLPEPLIRERLAHYVDYRTGENITSPIAGWEVRSPEHDLERATCACGTELVNTPDGWQHNLAPYLWGNDHDANPLTESETDRG